MPRRAAGPHQVRGHYRLAMTRFERVEGAEGRGDERGKNEYANARLLDPDQVGEGISSRRLSVWLKRRLRAGGRRSPDDCVAALRGTGRCLLVADRR